MLDILMLLFIINNIMLLYIGLKYFLYPDEAEINMISDNNANYYMIYIFSAMIILLISMWGGSLNFGDLSQISETICGIVNILIWLGFLIIYEWFEALDNIPSNLKSRHFLIFLISLGIMIVYTLLNNTKIGGIDFGAYNFMLMGFGGIFMYLGAIILENIFTTFGFHSWIYSKDLIGMDKDERERYIMVGILFPLWQLIYAYIIVNGIIII